MEKRDRQESTTKQTGRKDRNNSQLKISNQSLKENPDEAHISINYLSLCTVGYEIRTDNLLSLSGYLIKVKKT